MRIALASDAWAPQTNGVVTTLKATAETLTALGHEVRVISMPVGGGFGKAFQLGGQPMKLELDAYYNAIRPKAGNETWLLQAKLAFVFPD